MNRGDDDAIVSQRLLLSDAFESSLPVEPDRSEKGTGNAEAFRPFLGQTRILTRAGEATTIHLRSTKA
jgi:hypothetical protein